MKQVLLAICFLLVASIFPLSVRAESIDEFKTIISIQKAGSIRTTEQITYDFGDEERHGIFRKIPITKTNQDNKKFRLDFDDITVTDLQGQPYPFEDSIEDDTLSLKIGDANTTITGTHVYAISYTVRGALTYFSEHDELYWNSTGVEWEVPIMQSVTQLVLPESIGANQLTATCYTGPRGSTLQHCETVIEDGRITYTASPLLPFEGLTIVGGFPKGLVAVVEPTEVISFWDTPIGKMVATLLILGTIIGGLLWYIVYPLWLGIKWYRHGRDPRGTVGTTTASFDPPQATSGRPFTPAETGTLVDEHVDMAEISATIVGLAQKGHIKIVEKKKNDFYLEKLDADTSSLQPFEHKLLDGFFGNKTSIHIKNESLASEVEAVKKSLYTSLVNEKMFPENPDKIRTFYTGIAIAAGATLNIPLFLAASIFGRIMPKKTIAGVDQANIAQSLKNFLRSQERQLEFQAKNQLLFEKLLPFAVAFGVEKQWAKRFEDIDIKPPTWYQGYRGSHFTSSTFVHSLDSSFHSVSKAATPVSSSSGFSSGSSGGSSGGGGGGGGGGSW